jgi:hypothetical protein
MPTVGITASTDEVCLPSISVFGLLNFGIVRRIPGFHEPFLNQDFASGNAVDNQVPRRTVIGLSDMI